MAAVMFVQRTPGGTLVEKLRKEEEVITKQSKYRVKLVERAGSKLVDLLTKSDPFGGGDCGRENCYPCLTKHISLKWLPCWRRNLTYKVVCLRCKDREIKAEYHGESKDSLQKRALGHMEKLRSMDSSSFMLRHNLLHHGEDDPLNNEYIWYPTKFHARALDRQISEALEIKQAMDTPGTIVMNAKTEYSRCVLPGITPSPTEEEKKEDDRIRDQIKTLKALRDRTRGGRQESEPTEELESGLGDLEEQSGGHGAPPAPGNAHKLHGAQESSQGTQVGVSSKTDMNIILIKSIPSVQLAPDDSGGSTVEDSARVEQLEDGAEQEAGPEVPSVQQLALEDSGGATGEDSDKVEHQLALEDSGGATEEDSNKAEQQLALEDSGGATEEDSEKAEQQLALEDSGGATEEDSDKAEQQTLVDSGGGGSDGGNSEQLGEVRGKRLLLGGKYDLEEGKIKCNCLLRKWKFCDDIKSLAGGKVTPGLIYSKSVKNNSSEGEKGSLKKQERLRKISTKVGEGGVEAGEAGGKGGDGREAQQQHHQLTSPTCSLEDVIREDHRSVNRPESSPTCSMEDGEKEVPRSVKRPESSVRNQLKTSSTLMDFGFSASKLTSVNSISTHERKCKKRKKSKDVIITKQMNLDHYISTDRTDRRIMRPRRKLCGPGLS